MKQCIPCLQESFQIENASISSRVLGLFIYFFKLRITEGDFHCVRLGMITDPIGSTKKEG